MVVDERLIIELPPIDAFASSSVLKLTEKKDPYKLGEIASLNHKVLDHPMELGSAIVERSSTRPHSLFSSAQSSAKDTLLRHIPEVLCRLGDILQP